MTGGDIYTVAGTGTRGFSGDGGPATSAELSSRQAVAVDAAGNLVIADTGNNRIRVVAAATGTFYGQAMTAGDIYTVPATGTAGYTGDGGPATSARWPPRPASRRTPAGNLVIADSANNVIRVVAGQDRHVLRPADDRRRHLHHRRARHRRVLRRRRPGHQRRADNPPGVTADGAGNLVDRRHRQPADPGGRRPGRARSTARR